MKNPNVVRLYFWEDPDTGLLTIQPEALHEDCNPAGVGEDVISVQGDYPLTPENLTRIAEAVEHYRSPHAFYGPDGRIHVSRDGGERAVCGLRLEGSRRVYGGALVEGSGGTRVVDGPIITCDQGCALVVSDERRLQRS